MSGFVVMIVKHITGRVALISGTIVVAVSVIVAFAIHEPRVRCSYLGGAPAPKCPQPVDHLLMIRIGVISGGLIIAITTYVVSRILASRTQHGD